MNGTSDKSLDFVKELFETKLNSLNEKIDTNNKHVVEMLKLIKEDTGETNGKVMKVDRELRQLSSDYQQHLINSATMVHIGEINKKIENLNEENFIIKVWNRYPKQLLTIIVITVLLTITTLGYTMVSVHNALNKLKTETTQSIK